MPKRCKVKPVTLEELSELQVEFAKRGYLGLTMQQLRDFYDIVQSFAPARRAKKGSKT